MSPSSTEKPDNESRQPSSEALLPIFQGAATVSALFATLEAQMLVFLKAIPADELDPTTPAFKALLVFTYGALFISIAATVTTLILTYMLAHASDPAQIPDLAQSPDELQAIQRDVILQTKQFLRMYLIYTLLLGWLCVYVQFLIYMWLQESKVVKIVALCIALYTIVPLLYFIQFIPGILNVVPRIRRVVNGRGV